MAHWKESICLLTSTDPANRGFGTGFVFHRDGTGRSFLLTCLHVVETLEKPPRGGAADPPGVLADGLVAEVWVRGDGALDLAVLAVDGLPAAPLTLGTPIDPDRPVEIAGYTEHEPAHGTVVCRPLCGRARGNNPVKWTRRPGRVGIRSLDIEIAADLFRELKDGYSGSPVLDPETNRVVGVMNLKWTGVKGHAVCIGSCALLLQGPDARAIPGYGDRPPAGHPPAGPPTPRPVAVAAEGGLAWLASLLDHRDPLERVALCLDDGRAGAVPGLWFYAVEACRCDCPRALAEHLAVQFGGLSAETPWPDDLIVELWPVRYDGLGLWKALVQHISPPGAGDDDPAGEAARIVRWINRGVVAGPKALRVVYCQLSLADLGPRIRGFIEGAIRAFCALPGLDAQVRVLFLFACIAPESGLGALVARLRARGLQGIPACDRLGTLERLKALDLDVWLERCARPLHGGRRLDGATRDRLRAALTPLFPDDSARRRYRVLREPALGLLREATLTDPSHGDPG